jgi:hypothetical protein
LCRGDGRGVGSWLEQRALALAARGGGFENAVRYGVSRALLGSLLLPDAIGGLRLTGGAKVCAFFRLAARRVMGAAKERGGSSGLGALGGGLRARESGVTRRLRWAGPKTT